MEKKHKKKLHPSIRWNQATHTPRLRSGVSAKTCWLAFLLPFVNETGGYRARQLSRRLPDEERNENTRIEHGSDRRKISPDGSRRRGEDPIFPVRMLRLLVNPQREATPDEGGRDGFTSGEARGNVRGEQRPGERARVTERIRDARICETRNKRPHYREWTRMSHGFVTKS